MRVAPLSAAAPTGDALQIVDITDAWDRLLVIFKSFWEYLVHGEPSPCSPGLMPSSSALMLYMPSHARCVSQQDSMPLSETLLYWYLNACRAINYPAAVPDQNAEHCKHKTRKLKLMQLVLLLDILLSRQLFLINEESRPITNGR